MVGWRGWGSWWCRLFFLQQINGAFVEFANALFVRRVLDLNFNG